MSSNEAVGLYREWHKFDPSGVVDIDIPEPKGKLTQLGLLKRLDYLSEKWNKGEDVYYYHHFRKNPPMLFKDEKGNYFIYGYIRVTPRGIDDWKTTNNYVWKPPNGKKGVSKLGILQLLAYEDGNGQLVSLMFNDRYYVGHTDKDFTYISSPMMENPASCPYMKKIEQLVKKIEKNPKAMRRLEKALANYQVRENIAVPAIATEATKVAIAKATASQAFLKSIVTGVSTATFAVGITATILGGILVTWLTDFIKNKVVPPEMPPPPRWVDHMVKQFKGAGATDPADIQERIEKVWNHQDFDSKTAIYHREYGMKGLSHPAKRGRANAKCAVCGFPSEDHKFAVYKGYTEEHEFQRKASARTKSVPRSRANQPTKEDLAANRIRDMFRAPQYHGQVPDKDIKIILKPKGTWARAYGLGNMKKAWNSLKRENFVKLEGRMWIWQYPMENPEYTDVELIKKALEMIFRWAYLGKIGSPATAFKFFRDRNIKVSYQEVGYAFSNGRTKRHRELQKYGHILSEYPEGEKKEEKKENPNAYQHQSPEDSIYDEVGGCMVCPYVKECAEMMGAGGYTCDDEYGTCPPELIARHRGQKKNPESAKCPKCGGEGWLDVSGKYECVKCGHYFTVKDDPLSSRFNPEANPIKSKAQWRFLKARYPQMFESWQREAPVNYDELPERANPREEIPIPTGKLAELDDIMKKFGWTCRFDMGGEDEWMWRSYLKDDHWIFTIFHDERPGSIAYAFPTYLREEGHIYDELVATLTMALKDASVVKGDYQKVYIYKENPLSYDDYKEALEGEGWAIGDYKDMISKADTEHERKVLTHIHDEEEEHVDELTDLMGCKKKKNPAETILSHLGGEGK